VSDQAYEADVQAYIDEIVKPTIDDLERSPTSRRPTFLACVALFHTVDYLASRPGSPNKENLRNQFRQENQDFAVVDRVAHAFKHREAAMRPREKINHYILKKCSRGRRHLPEWP
jgi:hypothetical protein